MDYEKDVEIDKDQLDKEWLNQSGLALRYGRYWAECFRKNQQAQEKVKLLRSKLIKKVTFTPTEHLPSGTKPTGPVIEAFYRTDEKYIKAKEKMVEAQYELNVAEIAKKEISVTKKAALTNLVELHNQGYFISNNVPSDLSKESQKIKIQTESNKKVADKLTRRKK